MCIYLSISVCTYSVICLFHNIRAIFIVPKVEVDFRNDYAGCPQCHRLVSINEHNWYPF